MAGAKVVPIIYTTPKDELYALLDRLNGVLFTGGSLDLVNPDTKEYHPYTVTSDLIFKYAMEHTDNGDYFPLIGICQGFQLLNILQSDDKFVLKRSPSMIKNDTLHAMTGNYEKSRMFMSMDPNAEWLYSSEKVVVNLHNWGIYVADYLYNRPELSSFYHMITYEQDDDMRFVVTAIEAFNYPIYAFQFHPERTNFEFSLPDHVVPRSDDARQLSENLMWYFVDEARKNTHSFDSFDDETAFLIENQQRVWGDTTYGKGKFPYYVEAYLIEY